MARGQTVDQGPENVNVDGKQGPEDAMYMTKNSDNEFNYLSSYRRLSVQPRQATSLINSNVTPEVLLTVSESLPESATVRVVGLSGRTSRNEHALRTPQSLLG